MKAEIQALLNQAPDQIEEGGWAIRDLVPIKLALLKLAEAIDKLQTAKEAKAEPAAGPGLPTESKTRRR